MGGTNLGTCAFCEKEMDYDPLLGGKQYHDDREEEMKMRNLAEQAGLTISGVDEDGEIEFIGTDKEWKKFNELKKI